VLTSYLGIGTIGCTTVEKNWILATIEETPYSVLWARFYCHHHDRLLHWTKML